MKAAYVLWPNYEHLDRLVHAGIDTLLVTAHDLPWDKASPYYDKKEIVLQTLSRYRASCNLILVPLWVRDPVYFSVPDTQQWQDQDGRWLRKTPCPTSAAYARSRVVPAVDLCHEQRLDGLVWDLEHLRPASVASEIVPFYQGCKPSERCWCPACRSYNMEDLWKAHAGIVRDLLETSGIQIHGQLPYSYGWTMRQYPGDLHHFTEETYQGDVGWIERAKWEFSWWRAKVSPRLIPGAWCEWFSDEQALLDYLRRLNRKYGGFWLYSHEFFGNKIPNPHVPYPNPGPATDWFYRELARL